jgi:hypothetical protein
MNKMIRSLRSTLGTAFVLCGCALTLLSATPVASDSQAPGDAEQCQHDRKAGEMSTSGAMGLCRTTATSSPSIPHAPAGSLWPSASTIVAGSRVSISELRARR